VAEKAVEGIKRLGQHALDVVDGVNQARIELDLAPADNAHAAGDRHP